MSNFTPNDGQRDAIEAPFDQPVKVIAGAGTGKTEVISRRFIRLLEQNPGLLPRQILVLTFSNRAAAEMRARIFRAVTKASLSFTRLDLAAADISTFHAFGIRLLGDYGLHANIDAELPLLSDADVQELLDELQEEFLSEGFAQAYGEFDPVGNEQYDWKGDKPFKAAWAIFNQLRSQGLSSEAFHASLAAEAPSEEYRILAPLVDWLHHAYLARLAEKNQLDFDRIVTEAAELLDRNPTVQAQVRAQYRFLLVDEYQDTNYAQERLLKSLATIGFSNVTVVGDPRQAIYVWREARVENITDFPGEGQNVVEASLTENHRSLEPILSVANRAIEGYEFGTPPEFPVGKQLEAWEPHRHFEGTIVNLHPSPTREEEAQAIVAWINQARHEKYRFRDIAILIRARAYLSDYTAALEKAKIPFELSSENEYYTRPEILDAIHLLRTCLSPAENLSLARTLLSPAVGLAQAQVAALRISRREALWKRVCDPGSVELSDDVRNALSGFLAFWHESQRQRWQLGPAAFAAWVVFQSGLYAAADSGGRRALQKLLALTHGYESTHPADSLDDLAGYLRLVLDGDPREQAPEMKSDEDAVRIMTVHASKGLEFPVVIAADSRQKVRPNRNNQPFHEPDVGLIFPDKEKKVEDDPWVLERFRRTRNEARCLWYVTLTRAQSRLIVTATNENEPIWGKFARAGTFFEELWNREADSKSDGVECDAKPPQAPPAAQVTPATRTVDLATARQMRASLQGRLHPRPVIHTSVSSFRRYQQCTAAYRFYHVEPFEALEVTRDDGDDIVGDGARLAMGSAFHQLVALQAKKPDTQFDVLAADARLRLPAGQLATVKGWFESYVNHPLAHSSSAGVLLEQPLSLALEFPTAQLVVAGVADRLEPERLIDYKTDSRPEGLVERYGDQLRLYAMAARLAGQLSAEAALTIYHVPTAAMISVPFTADDETRLMRELEDFADRLAKPGRVLSPTPGPHCTWCAAREQFCVIGQKWLTGSRSADGKSGSVTREVRS